MHPPGLLPDTYRPISIAHLLSHTSGLPDESGPDVPELETPESIDAHRRDRWTPERLMATVTRNPGMQFTPGGKQRYRGANHVLLAMVVERVTGRAYGKEIHRRLSRPLGLAGTSAPGQDPSIEGPHVHGYLEMSDGRLKDFTEYDQSYAWGEGELISTGEDLECLLAALFAGELLPRRLVRRMTTLLDPSVRMGSG
ncbi:serine hydrolase domain-containing protein [Streptomyces sp. NPDC058257]|uniref:serine hydrolase domain-containing protein n=1 Tax=Streptomyces sp. NPDC058257 TaxID=3346409 RepID=UPI0036EE15F5